MSKMTRLIVILAAGWATACGSPDASQAASTPSSKPPVLGKASATPVTATSTPDCVGLSICPPPPPDADGNPACFYSDGWQATSSGAGIEVWYFHEPQNMSKPDKVTAVVRRKDGTTES